MCIYTTTRVARLLLTCRLHCQIIKKAVKALRFRVHYQHLMDELDFNGHGYSGPGSELNYDQVLQVGPLLKVLRAMAFVPTVDKRFRG